MLLPIWVLFLSLGNAADTLRIAPCDEAVMNLFGDLITLSRSDGALRRYTEGTLKNLYTGKGFGDKIILQDPLRPVLDEPDNIYVLDIAGERIVAWDRFLNVRSVTPLKNGIVSPAEFTVTSEHDWLIYDDFKSEIVQIRPRENTSFPWGDRPVSGEIRLQAIEQGVFLYLKDLRRLRISDVGGTTLKEYALPDSLSVLTVIPLNRTEFGLVCPDGTYLWKPERADCRYLSGLQDVIFLRAENNSHILINRRGVIVHIP